MYPFILAVHSFVRWLVLISVIGAIIIGFTGWRRRRRFTAGINTWCHWTATIAHIQLLLGMLLYFKSPVVATVLPRDGVHVFDEHIYFRYVHITLMFIAVILVTIGSAKAKRAGEDRPKFRTMLLWYAAGLLILLIAIPWPHSPLAGRPLFRSY